MPAPAIQPAEQRLWVLIVGDVNTGFKIVGPFTSIEDTFLYASTHDPQPHWSIAPIAKPMFN